jgi:hypothetical protein
MQSLIDERDSANRITSANEEIQSSNEELQSINEEWRLKGRTAVEQ